MTITDRLRQAIEDSGETLYRVAKDSGLNYAVVHSFARGGEIKMSTADKLADYFGLELRPRRTSRRRSK